MVGSYPQLGLPPAKFLCLQGEEVPLMVSLLLKFS